MRILRALAVLLLLGNLLLFAAAKGLFGSHSGGEPERLADQLDAQKIVIVQAGPAAPESAPVAANGPAATGDADNASPEKPEPVAIPAPKQESAAPADACRRYTGVAKDKAARIAALAKEGKLKVVQKAQDEPSSWWVHIPSQPSREDVDKRIAELRAAGVSDFFVVQEAGPNHFALSLGLFKLERMALDLRDRLRAKGVAQARVSPRESATAKVTLELRGGAEQMALVLPQIASAIPGTSGQACGSAAQPGAR
jgi:hypothetical protein